MAETRTARLFRNGASQAVRLPAEFRFDSDEVYVSRDAATGDVVLSTRPGAQAWREFFELLRGTEVPEDFLRDRPLNLTPAALGCFDEDPPTSPGA